MSTFFKPSLHIKKKFKKHNVFSYLDYSIRKLRLIVWNVCDMCFALSDANIARYADDNVVYIWADSVINESVKNIQNDFVNLFNWFSNNPIKLNKKQTLGKKTSFDNKTSLEEKTSFDKKPWLNRNIMKNMIFKRICQKSHRKKQTTISLEYMLGSFSLFVTITYVIITITTITITYSFTITNLLLTYSKVPQ